MPTLDLGDRLYTSGGRASWLKRGSVPLSAWAGGGHVFLSGDGRTISYSSLYRTQPWVAVLVNKLNRQISSLPLKIYRSNSQNDRERVRDGSLAELLRNPWPRAAPVHLKQKLAFPALLHGNATIAKYRPRAGRPPTELLPLDWRYLAAHDDGQGGTIDFWETSQTGRPKYLAPDAVIHVAWEAPDGNVGVSPLQQLGITLAAEEATQRYVAAAFNNGVQPSGAVVLPADEHVDAEVREEIRQEIHAIHGGVDNAFRMMVLGGGADLKSVAHTAKEAELVESRKLNREEVAAVYDVPPPMVGILDKATYSNINEQHRMLYTTVLRPWLTLIEETIQAQLIDPEPAWEGLYVEFDLGEVLKGDPKERAEAAKTFIGAGVYTINEWRALENLPRIERDVCDLPLIPVNNVEPAGESPRPDARQMLASMDRRHRRALERVLDKASAGALASDDEDLGRLKAELGRNGSHH